MTESFAAKNAQLIKQRFPDFAPKIALILGSGSAGIADEIQNIQQIPYSELEGFPQCGVAGHSGILSFGHLFGVQVACLQGRPHFYEGNDNTAMQTPIRTLKAIGCDTLLMTNASASLRPEVGPGSLVAIRDHINFSFRNPLVGKNDDDFGPRFPAMDNAYDPELRELILNNAAELNIPMTEGVYFGVLGPSYETPAEINAFRMLGGEVVGMSTVADVIIARHCDMRVATIAIITNFGVGMTNEKLTHENVLKVGQQAASNLTKLLKATLENMRAVA